MGSFDSSADLPSPGAARPDVSFGVRDGRLTFGPGDLDDWAEHLAWCLELLGIGQGATIAVQDYGSSPLSFLASSLLTPTLANGVSERLEASVICLDASHDRVALTPSVLPQLRPTAILVLSDVAGLLLDACRRAEVDLIQGGATRPVLVMSGEHLRPPGTGGWPVLLAIERAMILAPECPSCGHLHLRKGRYRVDGRRVRAQGLRGARPYRLAGGEPIGDGDCPREPADPRIPVPPRGDG